MVDSVDRLVEARNLRIKELVSEVNYLKNDYKTMNKSLAKTTRENATLKAALSHINDLAPAMHQYTDIEYGMVMKAREALKGE